MSGDSRGKKRCRWCLDDMDIDASVCPHCQRKQGIYLLSLKLNKFDFHRIRWRNILTFILLVLVVILMGMLILIVHENEKEEEIQKNQIHTLQSKLEVLNNEINDPFRDTYYKTFDENGMYIGSSYGECDYNGVHNIIYEDLEECSNDVAGQDKLLVKFVCKNQYDSQSVWYFDMLQSMYILQDGKILQFTNDSTEYSTSAYVEPGDSNIVAATFYVDKNAEKVEIIYHSDFGGMVQEQAFRVK